MVTSQQIRKRIFGIVAHSGRNFTIWKANSIKELVSTDVVRRIAFRIECKENVSREKTLKIRM